MAFCDVCGKTLKEEEEDREIKGKQVCHDCLYDGLKLLQGKFDQLQSEGRDRRESKQNLEDEEAADTGSSEESSDTTA